MEGEAGLRGSPVGALEPHTNPVAVGILLNCSLVEYSAVVSMK